MTTEVIKTRTRWQLASSHLSTPSLVLAVAMLAVVALVVAVVPFLPTFDPYSQDLAGSRAVPFTDPAHLLGTDALGRDTLSRLAVATRVSLLVALGAVAISAVVGLAIGLLAGWRRGRLDSFLMAVGDVQLAIPVVLLLIVLVAALGSSPLLLVTLLGLTNWVGYGRVTRSLAVSLREREFVAAVTAAGGGGWWIVRKHLLPNVLPQVLILAAFEIGVVITIESSLSFLGLGIQPPTPSLGLMINEGQKYLQTDPALTLLPALMILFVIGGIQFVSQGIAGRSRR
ncbi:peptide/nickel transport system permease protein [Rathayibacter oskolensis]|uniref:Peptide/nickel transport system permease protein n=1 Tax=Rathayibacter oskolensis TaxID=1891671 RepID=A0A1X7MTD1_9MICO|nr:ABC transporter permease [Rathayibacter oskolensis]SMH28072.1 peptide/nickel transport system permease protein [Rathayibacter oskolensis]